MNIRQMFEMDRLVIVIFILACILSIKQLWGMVNLLARYVIQAIQRFKARRPPEPQEWPEPPRPRPLVKRPNRDQIAALVAQGLVSTLPHSRIDPEACARLAYTVSDALIAERDRSEWTRGGRS